MRYFILVAMTILSWVGSIQGQDGTYFGVKGFYGANMQLWNNYDRDMHFSPGIDLFSETYEEGSRNSFYAQFGYHQRGSTLRGYGFDIFRVYKFDNLVLELGAKQGITMNEKTKTYYLLGIRGEYNLGNNLNTAEANSIYSLVDPSLVNRFLWGVSVGGGIEMDLGNDRKILIELTVNPDISKQYFQPVEYTFTDPNGITYVYPKQEVRNISIELKVGYKFLY